MENGATRTPVPLGGSDPFVVIDGSTRPLGLEKVKPIRFWNTVWVKDQISRKISPIPFVWYPYDPSSTFAIDPAGGKDNYSDTFTDLAGLRKQISKYPYHWPNNGLVYFYTMLVRLTIMIKQEKLTIQGIYNMISKGYFTQLAQFPEMTQIKIDPIAVTSDNFNHYDLLEIITTILDLKWTKEELTMLSWLCDLDFLYKIGRIVSSESPNNLFELAQIACSTGMIIPESTVVRDASPSDVLAYSRIFSHTIVDQATLLKYLGRWQRALEKTGTFIMNSGTIVNPSIYPQQHDILNYLYRKRNMINLPVCWVYLACYDLADNSYYQEMVKQAEPSYYNSNFSRFSNIEAIMLARIRGLNIKEMARSDNVRGRFLLDLIMLHMNITPHSILNLKPILGGKENLTLKQAIELFSQGYLVLPHYLANPSLYESISCLLSSSLVTTVDNACFIVTLNRYEWENIFVWFNINTSTEEEINHFIKLFTSAMLTGRPSMKSLGKLIQMVNKLDDQIYRSRKGPIFSACHCNSLVQLAQLIMNRHPKGIDEDDDYIDYIRTNPYQPSYIDAYHLFILISLIENHAPIVLNRLVEMGVLIQPNDNPVQVHSELDNNFRSYVQSLDPESIKVDLNQLLNHIKTSTPGSSNVVIDLNVLSCLTNKTLVDFIKTNLPNTVIPRKRDELIGLVLNFFHQLSSKK